MCGQPKGAWQGDAYVMGGPKGHREEGHFLSGHREMGG